MSPFLLPLGYTTPDKQNINSLQLLDALPLVLRRNHQLVSQLASADDDLLERDVREPGGVALNQVLQVPHKQVLLGAGHHAASRDERGNQLLESDLCLELRRNSDDDRRIPILGLYLCLEAPLAFLSVQVIYEELVRGRGNNEVLVLVDAHPDQTVAAAGELV